MAERTWSGRGGGSRSLAIMVGVFFISGWVVYESEEASAAGKFPRCAVATDQVVLVWGMRKQELHHRRDVVSLVCGRLTAFAQAVCAQGNDGNVQDRVPGVVEGQL